MTSELRFVLDTNTVVSALLFDGSIPQQALDLAFDCGTVLTSVVTLNELHQVLRRKRFDRYITLSKRLQFLDRFDLLTLVIDTLEQVVACRDPKDDKFLEVAVNGLATCLVSGDRDLLDLHPFRDFVMQYMPDE